MQAGELFVKISADSKNFERQMTGVTKTINSVGKSMERAGKSMSTFVTVPIVGVGVALGKAAMDLEATEAKYSTVFQGMTDDADAFIRKFQELTPATAAEARSMASGIQDLLVPMGFVREEATQMTGEFMHVAGALANFNSGTHSAEQVMGALQSAILGQFEPLKSLGVQLDATTVKEKAVEMGLAATTEEVTKQMISQVVLAEVYAQSGDALEAYTAENFDAKTEMGLMRAEAVNVAADMGTILLPMIREVIGGVREAIEWFSGLTEGQQELIIKTGALVAAIGPMLIIFGKVATAVSSMIALTNTLKVAMGVSQAAGLAGSVGGATTAMSGFASVVAVGGPLLIGIGLVVAAVTALRREYDGMTDAAKRAADASRASFAGVGGPGGVSDIARDYRNSQNNKIPTEFMDGSTWTPHALGLNNVPYDGYKAILHKGERVMTAAQNRTGGGDSTVIVQNMHVRNDNDIRLVARELYALERRAMRGGGMA